jgi:hypothetical protein
MARKDLPDLLILTLLEDYQEYKYMFSDYTGGFYDYIEEVTGECSKVVFAALDRAVNHRVIDYGVSLRNPWMTTKGQELLNTSKTEEV